MTKEYIEAVREQLLQYVWERTGITCEKELDDDLENIIRKAFDALIEENSKTKGRPYYPA